MTLLIILLGFILSLSFCFHLSLCSCCRSFSSSVFRLVFGRPLLFLHPIIHVIIFGVVISNILSICPNHLNLRVFTMLTMLVTLYKLFISLFVFLAHPFFGLLLKNFPQVSSSPTFPVLFVLLYFNVQVSMAYVTTGLG